MKKKLSLVLALVTILSILFSVNVFAAAPPTVYTYPSISASKYIEFTAQENIDVYKDTACKTRGTSSPSKKYNAYISKNDVCYIYKITESYIQVNYPTSSGRRTGYIKRSALFDKTAPIDYVDSSAHKVQVYKTKDGGYVAKGDEVWRVDPKKGYSGYRAVIYEAKSGKRAYKMGYVTLDGWDDIYWSDVPVVDTPNVANNNIEDNTDYSYVSKSEIEKAVKEYDIKENSNAHKALKNINSVYSEKLTETEKKGTNVFLFEGVGNSSKSNERFNAMCVVVKNKKIVYLNRNSTTIPDYPFNPKNNRNDDNMPTLISGIYNFCSHDHPSSLDTSDGKYAALKIKSAKVLRFKKDKTYYEEKGVSSINIHRRIHDDLSKTKNKTWANSAGCMNIGKSGTGTNSEYSKFVKAVGIVNSSWSGYQNYKYSVTGKVIIDREYADNYLSKIGYPKKAIDKL